jgi:hypothetical protein
MTRLAGDYETPGGGKVQVGVAQDGKATLIAPCQPAIPLIHTKGMTFKRP